MIVRKIHPDEVRRTEELFSISFDSPYNNEQSALELYEQYCSHPESRVQEFCLERFAAFEDDNKTMTSCIVTQPFHVNFDGHNELMYSIGNVSTLPQYRGCGGIREIFKMVLPYLYKQNVCFSYLYPFSNSFYRHFGYEICCKRQIFRLKLDKLPRFKTDGSCYLLDQNSKDIAASDIPEIYEQWQKRYNMMVLPVSYDYSFIEKADPYKDQEFTYIYRSRSDRPLSYMTFKNIRSGNERIMNCTSFMYTCTEGLKGLLSLAGTFLSHSSYIQFPLPENLCPDPVFSEWTDDAVKCNMDYYGMVRAVNVAEVLKKARYKNTGSISITITDDFIPENNHTFHIVFENGTCTTLTIDDGNVDISLSIGAFSSFITGVYDTCNLSESDSVKIYNEHAPLGQIFYKKPIFINTYF